MKPSSATTFGKTIRPLLFCFIAATLASCAPQTQQTAVAPGSEPVIVNGIRYATARDALNVLQENKSKLVAGVVAETDPIKGRALVIVPDHDRLRPLSTQTLTVSLKKVPTADMVEFLNTANDQDLHALADALVKNGTFQSVTVEERNDVLAPPDGDADFVVWYQVRTLSPNNTGIWLGTWLVRRRGEARTLGASADSGAAPGVPYFASFAKSVREASLRLGGTSVAGATASSLPAAVGVAGVTSGSGIVVDKQGGILTDAHVVGCTDPAVIDASNAKFPAHIVTKDQANDLAFLKTDHRWPQAASFRDGNDIRVGESVFAVEFPLTGLVSSSSIVTTGSVNAIAGPRDDSRLMQISAPIQPGNSGGAVLDNDGHVIGVVTSELNGALLTLIAGISPQNVNFALKSVIVRNFLDSQGVEFAHAASTQEMSAADVGALARRISVRVQCGG